MLKVIEILLQFLLLEVVELNTKVDHILEGTIKQSIGFNSHCLVGFQYREKYVYLNIFSFT